MKTEKVSETHEEFTSITTLSTSQPTKQSTTDYCEHMEYIDTLINSNAVTTVSEYIRNMEDFINKGVNFIQRHPVILVLIPEEGAIIRDVVVVSENVAEIRVTLTTVSGVTLSPIEGQPMNLPTDHFTTDEIAKIIIEFIDTSDKKSPRGVTLSVVACAPGVKTTTTEGNT